MSDRDANGRPFEYPRGFQSVAEFRSWNARQGYHWFSPSTMRGFKTRICGDMVAHRYFITSETNFNDTARLYSIRYACSNGSVGSVGEFQQWATLRQAQAALRDHLSGESPLPVNTYGEE